MLLKEYFFFFIAYWLNICIRVLRADIFLLNSAPEPLLKEKGQIVDESATKRQPVKEKNTFMQSHRDTGVETKKHTDKETNRQTDKQTHIEHG